MNQQVSLSPRTLVAIGVAAGVLGGGLGVGGGIILVPLLVLAGVDRHRAHATSLAAIVLIAVAGAISFGVAGETNVGLGITIGIGGVVGSVIGASLMHRVGPHALTTVFGVLLLVAAIRLIVSAEPLSGAADLTRLGQTIVALVIGVVAGFFAGLAGIGGGVVIVPSSVFFLGLDQHEAQGTSLVAIILTAIAGSIVNFRNQRVRVVDGLLAGAGGIAGSIVGSRIALAIEGRTLSYIFGFLVLVVAIRSLLETLPSGTG